MPNWVSNGLTIEGTKSEVTEFANILMYTLEGGQKKVISFHSTLPLPESESENWYTWQVENWGTKWDTCEADGGEVYVSNKEENKFHLHYCFDTAWSCPTQWLIKTSKQYPSLVFNNTWTEEQGYRGVCRTKNGIVIMEDHLDIPSIDDFLSWAEEHDIEVNNEGFEEEDYWEYDDYNEWCSENMYQYPEKWEL